MSQPSVDVARSAEVLLGQVADEFTERLQRGEHPDIEDYAERHPEIAELLRQVLPALMVMSSSTGDGTARGDADIADAGLTGVLGNFRIVREIGRGGMGIVYEAEQLSLGRRVALKVLPFAATMDPRQLQRFQNEARAAAGLEHPHIVPVYAVGSERGVHYYAMKFINGQTLADLLATARGNPQSSEPSPPGSEHRQPSAGGFCFDDTAPVAALSTQHHPRNPAALAQAAEWGIQAAKALDHAHSVGIVHRDIKPANLMVDGRGSLWVTDFGLARTAVDAGLTMTGDVLGTLRYMSPEQALAKHGLVDHRTDVYSLGVTLYELLTGSPAVQGKHREEILNAITLKEPHRLRTLDAAIPHELQTIVHKAMAKEPAERYATAQELADDLGRWLRREPIRARPVGRMSRLWRWCRRNPLVAALLGLTAALGLLIIVGLTVASLLILTARNEALQERNDANVERTRASEQAALTRRSLYPVDMKLAHQAWRQGDLTTLRDLLARYLPQPEQEDLRGFEWYYLRSQAADAAHVLRGHRGDVNHVAFSHDGRQVVTAGQDGTVRLWDVTSGRLSRILTGHAKDVNWACFAPDGQTVASVSEDGTVRLWDAASGRKPRVLRGHSGEVVAVEFSPDGRWLASGGDRKEVKLWDHATGRECAALVGASGRVDALAFTPDGRKLVACYGNGSGVTVWDLTSLTSGRVSSPRESTIPRPQRLRATGDEGCLSVAISPDGRTLAAGCRYAHVRLWNLGSGRQQRTLQHPTRVDAVAFSPDGRYLASGSEDHVVRLHDLQTGEVRTALGHGAKVWSVAFSPDSKTLASASADGTARLWQVDVTQGYRILERMPGRVESLAFAPEGNLLAAREPESIRLWHLGKQKKRVRLVAAEPAPAPRVQRGAWPNLVFARDGRTLIAGTDRGGAEVWDVARARLRFRLPGEPGTQDWVALSPDGRVLLTGGLGQPCAALGLPKPTVRAELTQQAGSRERPAAVRGALAFSPDGDTLATGWDGGRVSLWQMSTGRCLGVLDTGNALVLALVYSPDGRTLVSTTQAGIVKLWDMPSGRLRANLLDHSGPVSSAVVSPDGRTLVTAGGIDGTVRLWHLPSGRELFTLADLRKGVNGLAFSPDGQMLAGVAVGDDHSLCHVWEIVRSDQLGMTE